MTKSKSKAKKPKIETKSRHTENIRPLSFKETIGKMIEDNQVKAMIVGALIVAAIFVLNAIFK